MKKLLSTLALLCFTGPLTLKTSMRPVTGPSRDLDIPSAQGIIPHVEQTEISPLTKKSREKVGNFDITGLTGLNALAAKTGSLLSERPSAPPPAIGHNKDIVENQQAFRPVAEEPLI